MSRSRQAARLLAVGLTIQSAINARLLRRPVAAMRISERVSVLLPLRDEAHRVRPCLEALAAQTGLAHTGNVEFVILDDASSDATAEVVSSVFAGDPRLRLIRGFGDPPPGFLGKPWACARLADAADPRAAVLVFLDADVVLAPDGLARTLALLRTARLEFVSPYPRQTAGSVAERLIQPLLTWSWLTLVPLRVAERSAHPSLALANGQLLAVDADSYRSAGGHAAPTVRASVLEDIALARLLRRHGCSGGMAAGAHVASCRMYDGWPALRDGYAKSLWAAAGGRRSGSLAQFALLAWLYLRPDPVCYLAGVASRVIAARSAGARAFPDACAHPVSVALLGALTARSWRLRLENALEWKGRPVVVAGGFAR